LIGFSDSSDITNCYATGNVTGGGRVGGLVGINEASPIRYCYATGNVSGVNPVGGLVGYSSNLGNSIINCVAANDSVIKISGSSGRILGFIYDAYGIYSNNYANEDMVIVSSIGGEDGTGKSMATLKSFDFYNTSGNWSSGAWDIDENDNPAKIWKICKYGSLPYFQWQQGIACHTETDFGLIFDKATEKFYLDIYANGAVNPVYEYTGQSGKWSFKNDTLYLNGFE